MAGNLAAMLLFSGQWEKCGRLTAALLEVDSWCPFAVHTTRGLLLTRQGDFTAAESEFDHAERLAPPAEQWSVWVGRAELALWEGRHDQAATAVAEGLRWIAERGPEGVPAQLSCLSYALALRLEADRAEFAAARGATDDAAEAGRRAAAVIAALERLSSSSSPQARIPVVVGGLLLARAEQSRLEGRSDPERWRAAAVAWERLAYPFEAAYARFRQAEALLVGGPHRKQAETVLRPTHQTAVALGAAPLRHEIELLAQRGRLRLKDQVDTAVAPEEPSPAASLGLTRREAEVLALLAEGRTNPADRPGAVHHPQRPPAFTSHGSSPSGGSPVAGRRPRSPTGSASTSNDPPRPWPLLLGMAAGAAGQSMTSSGTSCWQRRPGHPAVLATCCSPGRVDVSMRSNALYDRCATESGVPKVSPMASKRAGQRAMRPMKEPDSRRLPADQ